MSQHIDLSLNESCELVAQIIDGAPNLEKIFIGQDQKSERKVTVEVTLDETASGGAQGQIKVLDKETKEVVFEMATERTNQIHIDHW